MKTMFSVVLAVLAWASAPAFAQEGSSLAAYESFQPDDRFIIRVEPQWLVLRELKLDFQIRLGERFSLGPIVGYMNEGDGIFSSGYVADRAFYEDTTDRFTYGLKGNFFFSGVNTHSAYLSGFVAQSDIQVTSKDDWTFLDDSEPDREGKFKEISGGLSGGYQWVWGAFRMNVGGGIQLYDTPEYVNLVAANGNVQRYELENRSAGLLLDAGIGLSF